MKEGERRALEEEKRYRIRDEPSERRRRMDVSTAEENLSNISSSLLSCTEPRQPG